MVKKPKRKKELLKGECSDGRWTLTEPILIVGKRDRKCLGK